MPESVINVSGTAIMWDAPAVTGRTILAIRPDIVLQNKEENNCLLIDIVIPDDSRVNTKEGEEPSKYKDLEIEVSRMWKVRTKNCATYNWSIRNN
jgi:hypothetical protein